MNKPFHWMMHTVWLALTLSVQWAAQAQMPCVESAGRIERGMYRSQIAQTNMYFSVYTPPCYEQTNTVYPVVYLMHGSNEDDGQWVRLGLKTHLDAGIADGTLPPMIVVMPFGEWIANENQFERVSWANVFLEELMPLVEARYRVETRREKRVIGGISRGGFWAFYLAFRRPDLFGAVGGHSAFLDDYHAPPEHNPLRLAQAAPDLDRLRIWFDRGKDDFAAPGLDLLAERLQARGLMFTYEVKPEGQHYLTYWRQHVAEYLRFYAAAWNNEAAAPAPSAPMFATNTPQATEVATVTPAAPSPAAVESGGLALFVPAAAFPSLQAIIDPARLEAIRRGEPDNKLTLDEPTAETLRALGVPLHPALQVIPAGGLLNALWRDRTRYTLLAFDRLEPRLRILSLAQDGGALHPLDSDLSVYPFAFTAGTPTYHPDRLTRLILSGVTALTRLTRQELDRNGVEWAGEAIRPYVERADFFHTSNEVSFHPLCPQRVENQLGEFCSRREHFDLFPYLGLDIVELTGNHNADYGYDAYRDTLDFYRLNGIATVGGGENLETARRPLVITHNGGRIIMLACNWVGPYYAIATENRPGAAPCDWNWLRDVLPTLAADSDLLIVTVQHVEYEEYVPTDAQRADFRGLADLGADIVVGTQAHKPQVFEFYNARTGSQALLHYGLGNLFFDQPFWGNMRFFMDQLFVYEGRLLTVDLFTGIIDDNARPRPMTADEQFNFLAFMFNTQGGF